LAVQEAESIGIPQKDLVPTYQAFGGGSYSTYILPTPAQEQAILSEWSSVLPNPAFDYAYSWGTQEGDTALSNDTALQQVFAAHNSSTAAGSSGSTAAAPSAPTITDSSVNSGYVSAANDTKAQVLSGTAGAGDVVRVYLNGSATPSYTAAASSSGQWSVTVGALANGAYSYTATATNAAGSTSAPRARRSSSPST
jgi:hypothetical protein